METKFDRIDSWLIFLHFQLDQKIYPTFFHFCESWLLQFFDCRLLYIFCVNKYLFLSLNIFQTFFHEQSVKKILQRKSFCSIFRSTLMPQTNLKSKYQRFGNFEKQTPKQAIERVSETFKFSAKKMFKNIFLRIYFRTHWENLWTEVCVHDILPKGTFKKRFFPFLRSLNSEQSM